jgi:hypothetical protein
MNTTVVGSRKFKGLARAHAGAAAAIRAKAVQQRSYSPQQDGLPLTARKVCGPLDTKTVIDCTNPIAPDLELAFELTSSAAEEIARGARGASVLKTFITAFAELYHSGSRLFGSMMITLFYYGDADDTRKMRQSSSRIPVFRRSAAALSGVPAT